MGSKNVEDILCPSLENTDQCASTLEEEMTRINQNYVNEVCFSREKNNNLFIFLPLNFLFCVPLLAFLPDSLLLRLPLLGHHRFHT